MGAAELIGKRERTGRVGETLIVLLLAGRWVCMPPFGRLQPVAPKWRKSSRRPSRRCTLFGTAARALPNFTIYIYLESIKTRQLWSICVWWAFTSQTSRECFARWATKTVRRWWVKIIEMHVGWKLIALELSTRGDNLAQEHETGLYNSWNILKGTTFSLLVL